MREHVLFSVAVLHCTNTLDCKHGKILILSLRLGDVKVINLQLVSTGKNGMISCISA